MSDQKSTKLNIRDNFEDVYLRSKTVRKYLPLADQSILTNREFNRVVNYMANNFYRKYRKLYRAGGFDLDDIKSVTKLFGLVFTGYGFVGRTERDKYTVMMHFIAQRLNQMTRWVARKFQADEVVKMQTIFCEKGEIERCASPQAESSGEVSADRSVGEMRRDLEKNAAKHSEALSYYSVSKFVGGDVRKKARAVCRKHGIDYQGWAKDYLAAHDIDESNFQIG